MEEVQKTSVNMKRLNFSKIVGDVAHSFESRALVSEKTYNYDVADNLFLRGDESALRKLVSTSWTTRSNILRIPEISGSTSTVRVKTFSSR